MCLTSHNMPNSCFMKRTVLCVLSAFIALALFGCGEESPPNEVYSLEDLPGKIVGALGGTPSARLAGEYGIARVYFSGDELVYGLTSGAVDCVVMESVAADELVEKTQGIRLLSDTLIEYELRFAVPRENAQLLDVVNSALAALETNGTLRSLRDKYFSGKSYTYYPPENIEQHPGELTLAITPDSPPYSFKDDNGGYTGLDIEVARAVCDQLGVELLLLEEDAKDLVTAVWFGKANLAAGWLPSDINEQVSVSEPYANTAHMIIVRK